MCALCVFVPGQQLHGGIDEVAPQIGRPCDETSDVRAVDDQRYLGRGTVGITDPNFTKYSRKPRPQFLLVAPGDDPTGMAIVGKFRRQVQERTAAVGRMPDPLRDAR